MEITAPKRSNGIRFLQKESSIWMFNPRAGSRRAIRLAGGASFQGSSFSNSDLSDTDYDTNYTASFLKEESLTVDGTVHDCRVVKAAAKSRKSPYARILIWMDTETDIPYRMDYYAHSGLLFKRMTLSDLKSMAGRMRPSVYHMESFDRPGLVSDVRITDLKEQNGLPDRLFTQTDLTR
jgi:outer membrane lipoprotein-sorting protein